MPQIFSKGEVLMRKGNILLSIIVTITICIFLVTLSQNVVARTSGVYSFYFNDTAAVSKLYVNISSSQFAGEIASFFNSFRPSEFQIYEDTGYDLQGVFDENESYNMMQVKKWIDISGLLCIASFLITAGIYFLMLRAGQKKLLRNSFRIAAACGGILTVFETVLLLTNKGRLKLCELANMIELAEDSKLLVVLGHEFMSTAVIFLIIMSLVIFGLAIYVNYRLTKPPRIFY